MIIAVSDYSPNLGNIGGRGDALKFYDVYRNEKFSKKIRFKYSESFRALSLKYGCLIMSHLYTILACGFKVHEFYLNLHSFILNLNIIFFLYVTFSSPALKFMNVIQNCDNAGKLKRVVSVYCGLKIFKIAL